MNVPPSTLSRTPPFEHSRLDYLRVFGTFARNSLIRDMTFRANFLIDAVSSVTWMLMNLGFYDLIFRFTEEIGAGTGWKEYQFYLFLATTLFANSIVQAFFMPNVSEFSELIRTGNLDFALLKPMDTQFLISFQKIEWADLTTFAFAGVLMGYSLYQLALVPTALQVFLYAVFLACGVAIMYSVMICMSSISVWLGRNQSLYDFWFYITNFSRYPMEIYQGPIGRGLRVAFTFVVPILLVVNIPARIIAFPLSEQPDGGWQLPLFTVFATVASLAGSRWLFKRALGSYRSASS